MGSFGATSSFPRAPAKVRSTSDLPTFGVAACGEATDEKAATPHAANDRVKALRQLFNWATSPEYDHAKKNPRVMSAICPAPTLTASRHGPKTTLCAMKRAIRSALRRGSHSICCSIVVRGAPMS
jgi:hypothetical protein